MVSMNTCNGCDMEMEKKGKEPFKDKSEAIKFQGILRLATRFEFDCLKDLWVEDSGYKYIPAPNFGTTGMFRDRFLDIYYNQRYSSKTSTKPADISDETYRWIDEDEDES